MRASDFITEQPVPPKKPGTIAVANMPVANKNISMKDQQMQKFKQQMQKDGGYQYTSQATRDTIAKSDKRVQDALRKQARVDAIGGAGASTIQRVKPVTFDPKNSKSTLPIAMDDVNEQPTVVKDPSGRIRSVQTPKIQGIQAKQTFRPDATPGYQQATYKTGSGASIDVKGSPETGFTKTVGGNVAGFNVQNKQRYDGSQQRKISYTLGNDQKISATQNIARPGAKPKTSMTYKKGGVTQKLTQSQFEDVQNAIREHVKMGVPFTECMFRAGSSAFTEFYRQVREVAHKLNLDWQDQELLNTDIGECIIVDGEVVPLDVPMEVTDELDEAKTVDGYELFHNSFSNAMQHAYAMAKKIYGVEIDPEEIDNKVATGPRKPSLGKTNRYRLKGKGGVMQIQVYNSDEKIKPYELNMYKESFGELDEAEYQGRKVKLNSPKRGGPKKFYVYVMNKKTGRVKRITWGDTSGLKIKAGNPGAVRSFVARHKCKQANDKMTARYWMCRTPRYKALGVKGGQWW